MNAEVRNAWKKELRKYVGIRSFVLVLPDEETASMPTMNRYKEVISMHTASNQAMSGVELNGIIELNESMELAINPISSAGMDDAEDAPLAAKTVNLSVREILMAITIPDTDKPLFHMIGESPGGIQEGFYPESNDREDMASQHTATLVMTQHIWV